MPDPHPDPGLTTHQHRRLAAGLFNRCWALLETAARTAEEDDEMVHAAHASAWHWLAAGGPVERARSHWQCARVYAALGRAEAAVHHARRCGEIAEGKGLSPFDRACAHEAIARALLCGGAPDAPGARRELEAAEARATGVTDEEEMEVLRADLEEVRARCGG